MRTLQELIAFIDERLAACEATQPGPGAKSEDYIAHIRATNGIAQNLIDELASSDRARFRRAGDAYQLALAGVTTTCTAGLHGLLRNWQARARSRRDDLQQACPDHVASVADPKVCGRCGIHIDELRTEDDDPINLQGSGPAPIMPREG